MRRKIMTRKSADDAEAKIMAMSRIVDRSSERDDVRENQDVESKGERE